MPENFVAAMATIGPFVAAMATTSHGEQLLEHTQGIWMLWGANFERAPLSL